MTRKRYKDEQIVDGKKQQIRREQQLDQKKRYADDLHQQRQQRQDQKVRIKEDDKVFAE